MLHGHWYIVTAKRIFRGRNLVLDADINTASYRGDPPCHQRLMGLDSKAVVALTAIAGAAAAMLMAIWFRGRKTTFKPW